MSIERSLIEHCSPTLASLKVGSLFSFLSPACGELHEQIDAVNGLLRSKGLTLMMARPMGERALCYLYRTSQLERMLADPQNAAFLRPLGYDGADAGCALERLCARLRESEDFPHEIGLFLGYPLGDVIGFIENKGKNCLCCGCWKAYTDACAARKLFDRFAKCTTVYKRLYHSGTRTLSQLAVSA